MSEFIDPFEAAPAKKEDEPPVEAAASAREEAIELARTMAELEADSRREKGDARETRIARAMAYAAWDYDGRSPDGKHLEEFEIGVSATPSLERAMFSRLLKKGKEKSDGDRKA